MFEEIRALFAFQFGPKVPLILGISPREPSKCKVNKRQEYVIPKLANKSTSKGGYLHYSIREYRSVMHREKIHDSEAYS